jgi:hypothetical protein
VPVTAASPRLDSGVTSPESSGCAVPVKDRSPERHDPVARHDAAKEAEQVTRALGAASARTGSRAAP